LRPTEFEVQYLKLYVDGKEVAEIDKYNYIAKFGDDDALASVRADLGLA
jgi:phage tail tube protein FII